MLLDMSATFDTIYHKIMLDRLQEWFCLEALHWIGWSATSIIVSSQSKSDLHSLIFGVPQGSVVGALLFIMYTTPLSFILSKAKNIKHQVYADDTQVHNSSNTSSFKDFIHNLQNCLVSVQVWMYQNKLKLDPDKTEFLLTTKTEILAFP